MPSLLRRERRPELMDDPSLDAEVHRKALVGLARINRWSGSAEVLWPAIRELARKQSRPLRLLDIATGSGDVPIALWQRAKREGVAIEISGCDISPVAVATATAAAAKANANIRFFVADVLNVPLPTGFDIITCSLFLHHLDEPDIATVLRKMHDAAESMVLVNDLARGRINFGLVWIASRLFSRSRVVHYDGPISVRGALTPAELSRLAIQSGLDGVEVTSRFPCRMLLAWRKPQ